MTGAIGFCDGCQKATGCSFCLDCQQKRDESIRMLREEINRIKETTMPTEHKTRAKFVLKAIEQQKYTAFKEGKAYDAVTHTYKFDAVYGDSSPENKSFWEATPSGRIELSCVKPQSWELGQEFYVDFSPAFKPELSPA